MRPEPKSEAGGILMTVIIVFFVFFSALAGIATYNLRSEIILPGVRIGDIAIGGLTFEEARRRVDTALEARRASPVTVRYRDQSWPVRTEDVNLRFNAESSVRSALEIGRSAGPVHGIVAYYSGFWRDHPVPIEMAYDQTRLHHFVERVAGQLDVDPKDARLERKASRFVVTPEVTGRKVNLMAAVSGLAMAFREPGDRVFDLPVTETVPLVTTGDLNRVDTLLGTYTTEFDASDTNRSDNIRVAARALDGALVRAGDVFSFNGRVGLRLSKHGYKIAPVYINGRLEPDWGGGVCQVSTTLYNAVLLADMGIVERTPHFRPPGYVPLGQDATVADNYLDLKFRNPSSAGVYVSAETGNGWITVSVYGQARPDLAGVSVISTDVSTSAPGPAIRKQDPEIEAGREVVELDGGDGIRVTTYRVKRYRNGETVREMLFTDEFKAVEKIVRVGTKPPPPAAPAVPAFAGAPPIGGSSPVAQNPPAAKPVQPASRPADPPRKGT